MVEGSGIRNSTKTTSVLTLKWRAKRFSSVGEIPRFLDTPGVARLGAREAQRRRGYTKPRPRATARRLALRRRAPISPSQMCASSWASVNICAALVSAPLTKISGGELVGQGEAAEFLRIELSVGVVADDTAGHHQHSEGIGLLNEAPQRVGPGTQCTAFVQSNLSAASYSPRWTRQS